MFKNTPAFSSFSAPDLGAIKSFYGDKLGLDVIERPEGLQIYLYGGAHILVYKSDDYHAPEHTVLNFVVDDIDKAVDELTAKGIKMEQYPDFHTDQKGISRSDGTHPGPQAIAWLKDPAEHIVAIIQEK